MNAFIAQVAQQNRRILVGFNVCFFTFLFYWVYQNISFAELLRNLEQVPLRAIFIAMTMNVFVLTVFGLRLSAILRGNPFSCFMLTTIGFTFNSLMPLKIGEAVKLYFGRSLYGYSVSALAAGVLLEKLFDGAAVALLAVTIAITTDAGIVDFRGVAIVSLIIIAALCALFFARNRLGALSRRIREWPLSKATQLDAFILQAKSVIASCNVGRAALLTMLIWTTNACLVWIFFTTLMPEAHFGFQNAVTLLLIGALAIAVPSSPAGLGIFEAGIVAYLINNDGIEKERALSAALAYHFSIMAPHTLIVIGFFAVASFRMMRSKLDA